MVALGEPALGLLPSRVSSVIGARMTIELTL